MARPRKRIDQEQLEKLAEKQWSTVQIAAFFRVSHDTIERRFASIIAEARARGSAKLIDLQWKRVLEGSDRILLHMSRHYLGQTNDAELEEGTTVRMMVVERIKDGASVGETILEKHVVPKKTDR